MILLIDNYDSFTFNLYQALAVLGAEVRVERNDALSVEEALALAPEAIVISPGPGRPAGAGITPALIAALPRKTPLLGVCLGHQALVEHYGGELEIDAVPVHGKSTPVQHDAKGLFADLPLPLAAGRYHSLRAVRASLPRVLRLTSWTDEGHVMAVQHAELPRYGVQFHPESILTPDGPRLLENFLVTAGLAAGSR